MQKKNTNTDTMATKCLIIVHSYHHNNTAKIACAFSEALHAKVKTLEMITLEDLQKYDLIGFGAGIDSGRHYKPLLDFVDRLPNIDKKAGFIFSTSAIQGEVKVAKDHSTLRHMLQSKGYTIIGEFSCKGFNTNSFLKYFGGMNKDRPNSEDLNNAREFALGIAANINQQWEGVS
jgi:flavodoxin